MVHVPAVGDLMGDDPAQQMGWRQDQSPVVANGAAGRTAPPSAGGVADGYRPNGYAGIPRRRRGLGAEPLAGLAPQEAFYPSRKRKLWTTTLNRFLADARHTRERRIPSQRSVAAFEWDGGAGLKRLARLDPRQLRFDPASLALSPFERGLPADPPRASEGQQPACFVDAKAHRTSLGMNAKLDGPGEARQAQWLRAGGRQDAIPGRRHRLR